MLIIDWNWRQDEFVVVVSKPHFLEVIFWKDSNRVILRVVKNPTFHGNQ